MSDNEVSLFDIEDKSAYLGAYLYIGFSNIIMAVLPMILWFAYAKSHVDGTTNMWFEYSWKGLWIGSVISYALPSLLWLLAFANSNGLQLAYLGSWILLSVLGGFYLFVSTLVYFSFAIVKYTTSTDISTTDIWITLGVYAAISVIDMVLTYRSAWGSILYMMASDVQAWCNDHPGTCDDWALLSRSEEGMNGEAEESDEFDF